MCAPNQPDALAHVLTWLSSPPHSNLTLAAGWSRNRGSRLFAWRRLVRRRALVSLTSGRAFRGIVWARRGPLLVMRDVWLLEPGVEPVQVDGEVVIERCKVEFMQVETSG